MTRATKTVLVLGIVSCTVPLFAMTQHGIHMSRESNGDVTCQAWFGAAFTPRSITAQLYSPSGALLDSDQEAATQYKSISAMPSAAPVGGGTYTCVANFEEMTYPEEYDTLNDSLYVD